MRALGRGDIRESGSGNIGATNVWRVHGAKLGVPVILVDVLKGFVPALLGLVLVGPLTGILAGSAAMLGHWRPLFLGLQRGGKMVATAAGVLLGVAPLLGLAAAAVWIAVFAVFRYASLASVAAAVSLPFVGLALGAPWPVIAFGLVGGAAVVYLHRANLARLRAGTETKFAFSRNRAHGHT